jgi:uncharacterized membrane protein
VELPELSFADLMGAKALAWTGGVVTLLGVVFFFVLAVNRGWIGPGTRVGLGAAAAAIVFAAGIWLRRRYGETYSALAAVGAGLAGGYATLLAATALYELLPKPAALAAAAAMGGLLWPVRNGPLPLLVVLGAVVYAALLYAISPRSREVVIGVRR